MKKSGSCAYYDDGLVSYSKMIFLNEEGQPFYYPDTLEDDGLITKKKLEDVEGYDI